ncbi:unnamed protein product [Paramecium octaurelia]|uniref:Uncharacterized protein n=1 Tax=Paramecium octaurelia TaxID=43137 RepID=A0A8S1YCB1_PAROT|nr:unnamed protein product [Paramecium octaurelia]
MKINLFNPKTKHSQFSRSTRATSMLSLKKVDESTVGTVGNWAQTTLPQVKKKEKKVQSIYQEDYNFLRDHEKFFKINDDDNSPYGNRKQQSLKILSQIDLNDINDLEERFTFVLKYLRQSKIGNLYNVAVFTYAYILEKQFQYEKAILLWQKYLVFCNSNRVYRYKIIAYKHLVELSLLIQDFRKALNYSKKLIKYTLFFNESNYELNAYDQIGKIFYYTKEQQLAKAFHEKFMDGEPMPTQNKIRQAVVRMIEYNIRQKQSIGQIDTDSEDDFELDKLAEPKNLEFHPIRFKDALLKYKHLWGHVQKQSEPLGPLNVLTFDKRLFQREYFTQLSNNNSIKSFILNSNISIKKNNLQKVIDKLINDIQTF